MASWMLVSGNGGESLLLEGEAVAIGRHPDNDFTLRDDLLSRFHCVLEATGDRWVLRDLGSRNGCKVNGERVAEAALDPGDQVRLGRHEFVVRRVSEEEGGSVKPGRRRRAAGVVGGGGPGGSGASGGLADAGGSAGGGGSGGRGGVAMPRPKVVRTDQTWAQTVRSVIASLPPEDAPDPELQLVDRDGRVTESLASDADGPTALRLFLLAALKSRATDVHTEPKGEKFSVRLRVDGQMFHIVDLPNSVGDLVVGIVKTACGMRSAGRDATLDGSFSAIIRGRRVDYRASVTPTVRGQKVVLRVLDERVAPSSLNELQMPAYMQQRIEKFCGQNTGLLLATGPTGSGKTTTLYNGLRSIDRQTRNVVTIEDPVEYYIDDVTQIPVKQEGGFGSLLRSVLRQDPDVILVGEIRDQETAAVALQAGMTGHLVFTTVHAKDSIGAVFRLLDLGVEQYLVANSMDLIIAQRLVRVLCPRCKRKVRVSPGQASRMGRFLEGKSQTYAPVGCPSCLKSGFFGRRALFELLEFTNELRDIVLHEPTIQAMRRSIETGVFTTLQQAGWLAAARGETSLDEVDAVVGSLGS